ncbi:MAG: circadian clock protein KaiC [Chitinophagaceae bacterium]|nr:circadian clock protein KaiC [Chitinophagaceae bacterium]
MQALLKTKTGINGLDEITVGGIPQGRTTLVCGGPGCGKTLLSMEFIVKGAMMYNEPGVFIAFEEKTEELTTNVASLGFDLQKLQKAKKLRLDYVHIDRDEIEETGEYDLDGLFIRLEHAIDSIGAKRVVLDTIENLFSGLSNQAILRAELRRLFHWLNEKGVTAIVTGEQGEGKLTRNGLEEYVSDCVILLDHRVINQISTRRLRVVKYRGSVHGTNEYPFLIDENGISVLPVTSVKLERKVSAERISTGIPSLDEMVGGKGFYRGSSILISGTAGTGKTSIAAYFANETCKRNEKCIFFAFEESPAQIIRNMKSIGLNLNPHMKKGLLHFHSARPALYGLEMHLAGIYKLVKEVKPSVVVLDPITNLVTIGLLHEVNSMLMRLIDFLQSENITVVLTALTSVMDQKIDEGVSSLVDAWISVKDLESNGERNRAVYVMKSRGMKHSNQVREFVISDRGVQLIEIFVGAGGIVVGSERDAEMRRKAGEGENEEQFRNEQARRRQTDSSVNGTKKAGKKTNKNNHGQKR